MSQKPYYFLTVSVLLFFVALIIFRVSAPLLGDGFYIVRNFSEALHAITPLDFRNEPLATGYYFILSKIFGVTTYDALLNAFLVASCILGTGFIVTIFFTAKNLITGTKEQFLAFLFLIIFPYMQLFFGYVETYGAVLTAVALYIFSSILYLRGKMSFTSVAIAFSILNLCHYLSFLMIPSLVYLAFVEKKMNGMKSIAKGIGIGLGILSISLIMINFDLSRLYAWVPHSHFLSLTPSTDPAEIYSEAYTLFSPYHGIDLLNYLMLLAAPSFILIIVTLILNKRVLYQSKESKYFISASIPVIFGLLLIKFDLGMAKDWDVMAPYFLIIATYAVSVFFHTRSVYLQPILALLITMTFFNTIGYLTVNARSDASLMRYISLFDKRTVSNYGYYSSTLSLALYYHQIKDLEGPIDAWERYVEAFPGDPQGYRNIIVNLNKQGGGERIPRIDDALMRWLEAIPSDSSVGAEYSRFCIDAGNIMYEKGNLIEAASFYQHSIELAPLYENGYNNLGSVMAALNKPDSAMIYFQKAIDLNPSYSDPYFNLGRIYEEQGNAKKAQELFTYAADLRNPSAIEKLKTMRSRKGS